MSDTIKEAQAQIKEKREHPKTRMNDDRLEKLRQEARQAYQQEEPLTWNTRTLLEICEHAHTMNVFRQKWRDAYEDAMERGGVNVCVWLSHPDEPDPCNEQDGHGFQPIRMFPWETITDLIKKVDAHKGGALLRTHPVEEFEVHNATLRGIRLGPDLRIDNPIFVPLPCTPYDGQHVRQVYLSHPAEVALRKARSR